jgi:hypothetical protein
MTHVSAATLQVVSPLPEDTPPAPTVASPCRASTRRCGTAPRGASSPKSASAVPLPGNLLDALGQLHGVEARVEQALAVLGLGHRTPAQQDR